MSLVVQRRMAVRAGVAGTAVAGLWLAVVAAAALAPDLIAPFDPLATDPRSALAAPSAEHLFGTDQAGRDLFSRVVHGARYSLVVGLGATALALALGTVWGVLSGLAPRAVDSVLSRVIVVGMAFPEFLLALIVVAVLGPGESSLLVALAIAAAPAYARVARSRTLTVRTSGYVRSSVALGTRPVVTAVRHVVPNTLGPLGVMALIGVGTAIVSAAGLSFLGLGPSAPTPEWGVILSDGRNVLATAWWVAVFPGLAITATVVATSVVGRRLRVWAGDAA